MPPQTVTTLDLYLTTLKDQLAIDALTFVDLNMNIWLTVLVKTEGSQKRLVATETSKFLLLKQPSHVNA